MLISEYLTGTTHYLVSPSSCLEAGVSYQIRIDFNHYRSGRTTPQASVLIDSVRSTHSSVVAKHQNRSLIDESMKLCTRVLWYLTKMDPNNVCPLMAAMLNSKMAPNITMFWFISPVLLHLGQKFKCLLEKLQKIC